MEININKRKIFDVFLYMVKVSIGCMFIYSSLPKIRQPYDFLTNVYSYELVGPKLGMFAAMTLPWLELLTGICLIGGIFVGGALLVCIAMATMFTFVLSSALYHDLEISCGCFGAGTTNIITYNTLLRAVIILILSITAYLYCVALSTNNNKT